MDDYDKLMAMLQHWLEHNDEHAETYLKWAEKASAMTSGTLPELLNKIAAETKNMSVLFKEAISALDAAGKRSKP